MIITKICFSFVLSHKLIVTNSLDSSKFLLSALAALNKEELSTQWPLISIVIVLSGSGLIVAAFIVTVVIVVKKSRLGIICRLWSSIHKIIHNERTIYSFFFR